MLTLSSEHGDNSIAIIVMGRMGLRQPFIGMFMANCRSRWWYWCYCYCCYAAGDAGAVAVAVAAAAAAAIPMSEDPQYRLDISQIIDKSCCITKARTM